MTKRVNWFPLHEKVSAQEFAELFMSNYFKLHGLPQRIIFDRDTRFMSDFWQEVMTRLGTKLRPSSPFHPQTDGAAEKANHIVGTYLKSFATKYTGEWATLLPLAEFSYTSSVHNSTGVTPFELDLGYNPTMPMDIISRVITTRGNFRSQSGVAFSERLAAVLQSAKQLLDEAQTRQKAGATNCKEPSILAGNKVFLKTSHLPDSYANISTSRKLQHNFAGPFKVLKVLKNAVELELSPDLGIDPIQNISYIKKSLVNPNREYPPPPPLRNTRSNAVHEIDKIIDHAKAGTNQKNWTYLVRWKGFGEEEDEWLSLKKLKHAKTLLDEYHREHRLQPLEWEYTKKELDDLKAKFGRVKKITLRVRNKEQEDADKEEAKVPES